MKLSVFLTLILVFFAQTAFCQNTCEKKDFRSFTCAVLSQTCQEQISAYKDLYGAAQTEDMYGSCPRNTVEETAAAIKNCALPATFIAATVMKNLAVRVAAGTLGAALVVDSLNTAIKADEKCFNDVEGKRKLIDEHNAKVSYVEIKLSKKLAANNVDLPEKLIAEMPCVQLRDRLVSKQKSLNEEIGKNIKNLSSKDLEDINNFNAAEDELKKAGVDLTCLRPSKKAMILCEVAAAGTGVAVIAASRFAGQLAQAQEYLKKSKGSQALQYEKRTLNANENARIRERAAEYEKPLEKYISDSVNFTPAESAALRQKSLRIYDSNLPPTEKIKQVSDIYMEARIAKLPADKQSLARKSLQEVATDERSYMRKGKIFMENGIDPQLVQYQHILAHEFEHVAQFLTETNKRKLVDILKRTSRESLGASRYRREIEAIGAQYDMLQLFPKEVIRAEALALKPTSIKFTESSAELISNPDIAILNKATTLSRDEYIRQIRSEHGYTGVFGAEVDYLAAQGGPIRSILKTLGIIAAGEVTGTFDKINEFYGNQQKKYQKPAK